MPSTPNAHPIRLRVRWRATAVIAIAAGVALGTAAPALAHDPVSTTVPAEGSVVTSVPETFSVTTTQPMLDLSGDGAGFGLQVTDAAGRYFGDGCLTIDDATLSMPATLGDPGLYTLVFQYISSDGHTTSGTVTFDYAPTDASAASPGSPTPPECGVPVATPSAAPTTSPTSSTPPSDAATPAATPDATATGSAEDLAVLAIVGGLIAVLLLGAVAIVVIARRGRPQP